MSRPVLILLAAAFALASLPLASATYWNYGFPTVDVNADDGSVSVGQQSCAGYGTPAPLVVVSSVPDPLHDCPRSPVGVTPPDPGHVVAKVEGLLGFVVGLVPPVPPSQQPTYWNYGFPTVTFQGGQVSIGEQSCAGYGTPAPLIVVGSVPNPSRDCPRPPVVVSP